MKVNKSIEQMIEEIDYEGLGAYYILNTPDVLQTPYTMFAVQDTKNKILNSHLFLEEFNFLIEEMLVNAIGHGNKYDASLIYSTKVLLGKKGWILRIRDSGPGFDYETTLKTEEYKNCGSGLKTLKASPGIEFNYENGGNTLNIMRLYNS